MFVSSEAVDHLVTATTIWDVEVVRKPLSQANELWRNTTRDNPCPRAFLDEFIQKICKDGGVCKTNSFQRAVRTEMPEGHTEGPIKYSTIRQLRSAAGFFYTQDIELGFPKF